MEERALHKLLDGIDIRGEGALNSGKEFSGYKITKAR